MAKSAQERIMEFKKILSEAEAMSETSGKDVLVLSLKKIIRAEELRLYSRFYFEQNCYFGLLLIQSQVFERQIKDLIELCELYIKKSNNTYKIFPYKKPLYKMSLGALIDGPLSYYINYKRLLISISNFNLLRRGVVHHLTDSYDIELNSLEEGIASQYVINDYAKIENMILEATTRINIRVAEITAPNQQAVEHIKKVMHDLLNLESENIKFKFDS